MSPLQILLIVAVASITVSSVSAVKCYVCSSCNDEFDASAHDSSNCGDSVKSCLKVKGADVVTRSCGTSAESDSCSKAELLSVEIETCSCTGDECNSAGMASASILVVLAASLIKFIL